MTIVVSSLPYNIPTTPLLPPSPVNGVIGSTYTFGATDAQSCVLFNSTAAQVATIPLSLSIVGAQITAIQFNSGGLKIVAGAGVTLLPNSTANAITQYSVMGLFQAQTNVWIAFGNFF